MTSHAQHEGRENRAPARSPRLGQRQEAREDRRRHVTGEREHGVVVVEGVRGGAVPERRRDQRRRPAGAQDGRGPGGLRRGLAEETRHRLVHAPDRDAPPVQHGDAAHLDSRLGDRLEGRLGHELEQRRPGRHRVLMTHLPDVPPSS